MRTIDFSKVNIKDGFAKDMQELNRNVTVKSVYDRFYETGRVKAFEFGWKEGMPEKPHIFWDSDIAKWMEAVAYILQKHPEETELKEKAETIIDEIEKNQREDGYFNIYFTLVEPEKRFKDRTCHELYCAGHLMEAAIAYAGATGERKFLKCMEKYADYIYRVFLEEDGADFVTPGHEEIELALVKLYRFTGKKKYLDLASFFINKRGKNEKDKKFGWNSEYNQSHKPVREQETAEGHSVRAVYLYTAMADLAKELNDQSLFDACRKIYEDITERKMYVTGGIGSCYMGENFSKPYDLPNEEAYTETCAGIGLMFFANRMMNLDNDSTYADTIERVFYNGVLSGLSIDGKSFFYENPLEITMRSHYTGNLGSKRYPPTRRQECFDCSCCPPNVNRLLASLGNYIYGVENDTLYVNQYTESTMEDEGVKCETFTDYPKTGYVKVNATGVKYVALRIPSWCSSVSINKPYTMVKGYAIVESDGDTEILFDMKPFAVRANLNAVKDIGRLCIQRGPIVYCAESIDNGENLNALAIGSDFSYEEFFVREYGLVVLKVGGYRINEETTSLYRRATDSDIFYDETEITMIPYRCFANREECDMLVWLKEI